MWFRRLGTALLLSGFAYGWYAITQRWRYDTVTHDAYRAMASNASYIEYMTVYNPRPYHLTLFYHTPDGGAPCELTDEFANAESAATALQTATTTNETIYAMRACFGSTRDVRCLTSAQYEQCVACDDMVVYTVMTVGGIAIAGGLLSLGIGL